MFPRFQIGLLAGVVALLTACAPFPVPSDWPVRLKADPVKVRSFQGLVATPIPVNSLTRQERALLTFLADNQRINEAIGKEDRYGTRTWKITEIFLLEPGKRVSVLCEEGHFQEPLYFIYNPANSIWYRVVDFEDPKAKQIPALVVEN